MNSKSISQEDLDELSSIDGFPNGKRKDIITLSDPPFFTAFPNPFLTEFVQKHDKRNDNIKEYQVKPYAFDVSEGKHHPIYYAHSYHTKVPHKAIMRYILHYTNPGDIIFDGFCGTGMTAVAAQMCDSKDELKDLGYKLGDQNEIYDENQNKISKKGIRYSIIGDISPVATFLAYNFNKKHSIEKFKIESKRIIKEIKENCGWLYRTNHEINGETQYRFNIVTNEKEIVTGKINYTIWSDVFVCPNCSADIVFWDTAVNKKTEKVKKEFSCENCGKKLGKRDLDRRFITVYDSVLQKNKKSAKLKPVVINYTVIEDGKEKRYEKRPTKCDIELLEKIKQDNIPYWFPINKIPEGYNTKQPKGSHNITNVHHFYTKRNLWTASKIMECARKADSSLFMFAALNTVWHATLMRRYNPRGGDRPLTGTLYISSLPSEANIIDVYSNKLNQIERFLNARKTVDDSFRITTQSLTSIPQIPTNSIDYIFLDPPFGKNLMYSELNFLWEAWLKVFTNNRKEAIINKVQNKSLFKYKELMKRCFQEAFRILKPSHWMTVEFHNSKNSVWIAIQNALENAGFIVADVRTLDKKHGSFKQLTTSTAVKQDLIISLYKPSDKIEQEIKKIQKTENTVWDFVREHLQQLPIIATEPIAERQKYLLYDRMVAFYVQRDMPVPLSANDFYYGLAQRFPERDGMYFLPNQLTKYERHLLKNKIKGQTSIVVHDERSAIQWLFQKLKNEPKTYQELHPHFLKQLKSKDKHENLPELANILKQNFLKDENNRWYVPDPNKRSDLEKLREKELLREFKEYKRSSGKLKIFRSEALRVGFKNEWSEGKYNEIVAIGDRIPKKVLLEDNILLMYYDNAQTRIDSNE